MSSIQQNWLWGANDKCRDPSPITEASVRKGDDTKRSNEDWRQENTRLRDDGAKQEARMKKKLVGGGKKMWKELKNKVYLTVISSLKKIEECYSNFITENTKNGNIDNRTAKKK